MTRVLIDQLTPLGRRIQLAHGVLESGQLANMRTYRLPREVKIHTRLVGENRTLCGRKLRNNDQWAWQFIHRGSVAQGNLPSGSIGPDACKQCCDTPVMRAGRTIYEVKREALRQIMTGRNR